MAAAVIALGYDRDFGELATTPGQQWLGGPGTPASATPGHHRLQHDPVAGTLRVPPGVGVDLGMAAKAVAVDRAAGRIARRTGVGVLVGIGGDLAAAGPSPDGGWQVLIGDDHRPGTPVRQQVSLFTGGLATSSTTVRRWAGPTGWRHHIVDPRTGVNPVSPWSTVSVAAATCVDANAASTAAIILGGEAPKWLQRRGLPALLVDLTGRTVPTAGWPEPTGS